MIYVGKDGRYYRLSRKGPPRIIGEVFPSKRTRAYHKKITRLAFGPTPRRKKWWQRRWW